MVVSAASTTARIELTIPEEFTLGFDGQNAVTLYGRRRRGTLNDVPPQVASVLAGLASNRSTAAELESRVLAELEERGLFSLRCALEWLRGAGALRYTLTAADQCIASLVPLTAGRELSLCAPPENEPYILSKFAYLHRLGPELAIESPLGCARTVIHDDRWCRVIASLSRAGSVRTLCEVAPHPDLDTVGRFVCFLLNSMVVVPASADDAEPTAGGLWWEFHDLLFHSRSRDGMHSEPYGGTWPLKDVATQPELIKPDGTGTVVDLSRPELEDLKRLDRSFTAVLEERRSIRDYGEEPLSATELGEFLYRSARIERILAAPGVVGSYRPSPSGGAVHELEIYPIVDRCQGLERGVYRYNPSAHHLVRLDVDDSDVPELVRAALGVHTPTVVYFVITARFRRTQWKYQSIPYALTLKNVGALYQTMYLVATAMGLAPCALGGGNSELFATATGLSFYEEAQVGEFVLGRRQERSS